VKFIAAHPSPIVQQNTNSPFDWFGYHPQSTLVVVLVVVVVVVVIVVSGGGVFVAVAVKGWIVGMLLCVAVVVTMVVLISVAEDDGTIDSGDGARYQGNDAGIEGVGDVVDSAIGIGVVGVVGDTSARLSVESK